MAEENTQNLQYISNELERERIIFLQGVLESDAKILSQEYPNLVIFSAGDTYDYVMDPSLSSDELRKYNDKLLNTEYNHNSQDGDMTTGEIVLGSYIFKNGIKYNIIRGIHPTKGKVHFGNWEIYLSIDHNGLLKLNIGNYSPRYFYVGYKNPLTDLITVDPENPSKYLPRSSSIYLDLSENNRTTEYDHNNDQKLIKYQSFEDIFDAYFVNGEISYDENKISTEINNPSAGIPNKGKYGIEKAFRDFDLNAPSLSSEVYIFLPMEYKDLIMPSNLLQLKGENSSYKSSLSKFQVVQDIVQSNILMDDECEYMVIKLLSVNDNGYKRIRIYKINNTN